MSHDEPIVFEVLRSYSSEIIGERVPVRATVPNNSDSFVAENAKGNLRQIDSREEILDIASASANNLLEIMNGQSKV